MGDLILALPPAVPGYSLLRRIGRGSYGEVWLARSAAGEFHAVKVVYRSTFEDDRPFERELSGIQKFEPVSRSNPSQISILQVGRNQPEGYFYYAMELADPAEPDPAAPRETPASTATPVPKPASAPEPAHPIDPVRYTPKTLKLVLQRRGSLSFHECLEISLALATALDHLHQHGLIHRDIKPSNVIFAGGVPKLADIGLVTDAGESISYVGTEGFLPPEGPGTPRADLYSLGKVLYEMSTGRDRLEFPELPTLTERIEAKDQLLELNQIFLKACQNDPRKRYASARAMRADLALLQSGRSLRRARQSQRRLAWIQSLALGAAAVAGLALLAARLSEQRQFEHLQQQHNLTNLARDLSSSMTRETAGQLVDLAVLNGERLKAEGDAPTALLWFSRALGQEPANSLRRPALEQRLRDTWPLCPTPVLLLTHASRLSSAHFSANGSRIITAGDDPPAAIWEAAHGQAIGRPVPAQEALVHACLSPDGRRALTIGSNGTARLWTQLEQDPVAFALNPPQPLRSAQFRSDGRQLLAVTRPGEVLVWEVSSRQLHFSIHQDQPLGEAVFSPDALTIATLDAAGQARLWDAETGRPLAAPAAKFGPASGLVFSPDARRLAARTDTTVRVWDARSGMLSPHVFSHDGPVHSVAFNPTSDRLATAGEDRAVSVWDLSSGARLGPPWHHPGPVQRIAYSPDGRFLASASGRQVQLAAVTPAAGLEARNQGPEVLVTFANRVVALEFSPSGHLLLAASADGTARGFLVSRIRAWLPLPLRPEDGWTEWAQLLAGQKFAGQEGLIPLSPREQQRLWDHIGAPARAGLAELQLADWHRLQAEACESNHAWLAALFHWRRASALRPQESRFQEGVTRAGASALSHPADRPPSGPRRFPDRPAGTSPRQIDLSAFYNAALRETWLPTNVVASGNDLAELPSGLQKLGGVLFDIRGVIQLSGAALETLGSRFPREVKNIPVAMPCRRIHFLQGATWSALSGVPVGAYLIHYADGQTAEVRVVYGRHLREWWSPATAAPLTPGAAVAWEGENAATRALGMRLRLYQMTWPNPRPGAEIASIDFRSAMEHPAPFLIAITTE